MCCYRPLQKHSPQHTTGIVQHTQENEAAQREPEHTWYELKLVLSWDSKYHMSLQKPSTPWKVIKYTKNFTCCGQAAPSNRVNCNKGSWSHLGSIDVSVTLSQSKEHWKLFQETAAPFPHCRQQMAFKEEDMSLCCWCELKSQSGAAAALKTQLPKTTQRCSITIIIWRSCRTTIGTATSIWAIIWTRSITVIATIIPGWPPTAVSVSATTSTIPTGPPPCTPIAVATTVAIRTSIPITAITATVAATTTTTATITITATSWVAITAAATISVWTSTTRIITASSTTSPTTWRAFSGPVTRLPTFEAVITPSPPSTISPTTPIVTSTTTATITVPTTATSLGLCFIHWDWPTI